MRPRVWSEQLAQAAPWAVKCRWMFTVAAPPAPGLLTIAQGRIVAIGRNESGAEPIDLGDVGLLPPLVNPHTHLELSDVARPLGRPGMPLPEWIRLVIERERRHEPVEAARRLRAAHFAGLQASASCNVRLLGDIVNPPWTPRWHAAAGVDCEVVAFRELLTLDEARIPPLMEQAESHLGSDDRRVSPALSPHAPFSTHPDLVRRAVAAANRRGRMVAMHLAESPEELELLRTGGGPFRELLDSLGAWREDAIGAGSRALDYLQLLAEAPRALVVHGNYLDVEEMRFLASQRERLTVVYCPRTHAYFRHSPYPLADMLARGVRVVIGTDSRASTPDLNILREWRTAARRHPDVAAETLLAMITTEAARALGRRREFSETLAEALTVVPLSGDSEGAWQQLLEGGEPRPLRDFDLSTAE